MSTSSTPYEYIKAASQRPLYMAPRVSVQYLLRPEGVVVQGCRADKMYSTIVPWVELETAVLDLLIYRADRIVKILQEEDSASS